MSYWFGYGLLPFIGTCSVLQSADLTESTHLTRLEASKTIAEMANNTALSKAQQIKKGRVKHKAGLDPHQRALSTAVIVVDIQWDFTGQPFNGSSKGSLAVDLTEKVYTDAATRFIDTLRNDKYLIVFTQDWHPKGHVSFQSRWKGTKDSNGRDARQFNPFAVPLPGHTQDQVLWPDHCVQGSKGAEIILPVQAHDIVVQKGMNLDFDSYSGFKDRNGTNTAMEAVLDTLGITNLIVIGIATDYCVKDTVMDALALKKKKNKNKYNVFVVTNLCRGVNDKTSLQAFHDMQSAGAILYWIEGLDEGVSRETREILQKDPALKIHIAKNLAAFLEKTLL